MMEHIAYLLRVVQNRHLYLRAQEYKMLLLARFVFSFREAAKISAVLFSSGAVDMTYTGATKTRPI